MRFGRRTQIIFAVIWAVAWCLILNTGVVHAATPRSAERAVESKLRSRYLSSVDSVDCERTGRNRFFCEWSGMSRADIREGNTSGTDGIAFVSYYGGRASVRIV